jgi:hypothetical protein
LGPQDGELIGDLELAPLEAIDRGRPATGRAGFAAAAHRDEQAAPHENALKVRRRDVMPECGTVVVAQL